MALTTAAIAEQVGVSLSNWSREHYATWPKIALSESAIQIECAKILSRLHADYSVIRSYTKDRYGSSRQPAFDLAVVKNGIYHTACELKYFRREQHAAQKRFDCVSDLLRLAAAKLNVKTLRYFILCTHPEANDALWEAKGNYRGPWIELLDELLPHEGHRQIPWSDIRDTLIEQEKEVRWWDECTPATTSKFAVKLLSNREFKHGLRYGRVRIWSVRFTGNRA